ncbi:MAG: RNase P modulator RnpM [Bacilli bacterium]
MRKCVVSNEMFPKRELIRIVRSKEGEVSVDPTGKKSGRGAYMKKDTSLVADAQKKRVLERHLEVTIPQEIYAELIHLIERESIL